MLGADENKLVDLESSKRNNFEGEVNQLRDVVLPKDPFILDEIQQLDGDSLKFVRLEKYNHNCNTAFLINDYKEQEISESNKLRQGYRLTFSQYKECSQTEYRTFQKPIYRPIALYVHDKPEEGKQRGETYLFQGNQNETFWFSVTHEDQIDVSILELDDEKPLKTHISTDSTMWQFILEQRNAVSLASDFQEDFKFKSAVPRLLSHEDTKIIVFSYHEADEKSAAVYFYDVDKGKEILCVQNAEMFLHCLDEDLSQAIFYTTSQAANNSRADSMSTQETQESLLGNVNNLFQKPKKLQPDGKNLK